MHLMHYEFSDISQNDKTVFELKKSKLKINKLLVCDHML